MEQFTSKPLTPIEREQFNKYLSKYIFETGTPFQRIENENLWKALNVLRPGVDLKFGRKFLAGTLLNNRFNELSDDMAAFLKNEKYIALTTDGWTNTNGMPVVNYKIH